MSAAVDKAGLMRSGGIWAVQGPYLLTSTDNGASWRAASVPDQVGSIFVLDPQHAWAIGDRTATGPGHVVVYRTADGGTTWNQATVTGDFECDTTTFSFVDAEHGFIMCALVARAPDGPITAATTTPGTGTVLKTVDGGASWSVAGHGTGLGASFTASDATTLWSAPDPFSSQLSGAALHVSRDAGATWSAVDLPEAPAPFQPPTQAEVAAGPEFWDASNGAFAISVAVVGTPTPQATWFYRTSDGGRTWALVKKTSSVPPAVSGVSALAGRIWVVVGTAGFFGLTVSSDFGSSWTDVPGLGMPPNTSYSELAMIDASHGLATAFLSPGTVGLMLTSDGGRSWHPADFGDARTKVPADPAQDAVTARNKAQDFAVMAFKTPQSAWGMLSAYSQRGYGSSAAFEGAQAVLAGQAGYATQVGEPSQSAAVLSQSNLGAGVWSDLAATAAMSRAYVVEITSPGSAAPPETIVVAPLAATGEWRVWVVTMP